VAVPQLLQGPCSSVRVRLVRWSTLRTRVALPPRRSSAGGGSGQGAADTAGVAGGVTGDSTAETVAAAAVLAVAVAAAEAAVRAADAAAPLTGAAPGPSSTLQWPEWRVGGARRQGGWSAGSMDTSAVAGVMPVYILMLRRVRLGVRTCSACCSPMSSGARKGAGFLRRFTPLRKLPASLTGLGQLMTGGTCSMGVRMVHTGAGCEPGHRVHGACLAPAGGTVPAS
jgi:hypothetical protein